MAPPAGRQWQGGRGANTLPAAGSKVSLPKWTSAFKFDNPIPINPTTPESVPPPPTTHRGSGRHHGSSAEAKDASSPTASSATSAPDKVCFVQNVTVTLKCCQMSDDDAPQLVRALDESLFGVNNQTGTSTGENTVYFITIDLSENKLTCQSIEKVVKWLLSKTKHARLRNLKAYKNSVSDVGAKALAKLVSTQASPLEELHLSHNEITDSGAAALFKAFAQAKSTVKSTFMYPRFDETRGAQLPIWIRLEYNRIVDTVSILDKWEAEAKAFRKVESKDKLACFADRPNLPHGSKDPHCSPARCIRSSPSSSPLLHLYSFHHQSPISPAVQSTQQAASPSHSQRTTQPASRLGATFVVGESCSRFADVAAKAIPSAKQSSATTILGPTSTRRRGGGAKNVASPEVGTALGNSDHPELGKSQPKARVVDRRSPVPTRTAELKKVRPASRISVTDEPLKQGPVSGRPLEVMIETKHINQPKASATKPNGAFVYSAVVDVSRAPRSASNGFHQAPQTFPSVAESRQTGRTTPESPVFQRTQQSRPSQLDDSKRTEPLAEPPIAGVTMTPKDLFATAAATSVGSNGCDLGSSLSGNDKINIMEKHFIHTEGRRSSDDGSNLILGNPSHRHSVGDPHGRPKASMYQKPKLSDNSTRNSVSDRFAKEGDSSPSETASSLPLYIFLDASAFAEMRLLTQKDKVNIFSFPAIYALCQKKAFCHSSMAPIVRGVGEEREQLDASQSLILMMVNSLEDGLLTLTETKPFLRESLLEVHREFVTPLAKLGVVESMDDGGDGLGLRWMMLSEEDCEVARGMGLSNDTLRVLNFALVWAYHLSKISEGTTTPTYAAQPNPVLRSSFAVFLTSNNSVEKFFSFLVSRQREPQRTVPQGSPSSNILCVNLEHFNTLLRQSFPGLANILSTPHPFDLTDMPCLDGREVVSATGVRKLVQSLHPTLVLDTDRLVDVHLGMTGSPNYEEQDRNKWSTNQPLPRQFQTQSSSQQQQQQSGVSHTVHSREVVDLRKTMDSMHRENLRLKAELRRASVLVDELVERMKVTGAIEPPRRMTHSQDNHLHDTSNIMNQYEIESERWKAMVFDQRNQFVADSEYRTQHQYEEMPPQRPLPGYPQMNLPSSSTRTKPYFRDVEPRRDSQRRQNGIEPYRDYGPNKDW